MAGSECRGYSRLACVHVLPLAHRVFDVLVGELLAVDDCAFSGADSAMV